MKIHNFEQGTDEWIKVRLGKFTATTGQAVATAGSGLDTVCFEKVAEIVAGVPSKEEYTNENIERGRELEEIARADYELENSVEVQTVGFCELDEYVGCSPDGLVGEDGLIEIKCQDNKNYIKTKYLGKPDSKYMWQMQFQMYVTGRKWCDFVVFNENFEKAITIRIDRDEAKIKKIEIGLEIGINKIKNIMDKI